MKINHQYDQDMCICEELIPGTVEWHKEEGGDNILLQYINGGEGFRAIERFPDDVFLTECHYNGSGLFIKKSDGKSCGYHKDKHGNYRPLGELSLEKTLQLQKQSALRSVSR